ncbi:uncharacterized protein LOC110170337 [Boleophthalmus pectinirostris]|uniref:uncharacterized protein LOC110170337 n=1 Tax=Boleophthalmus pectinirostris TaxID=150288 RepID=UPI002432445F|nr:uncharacterized protein LOC110170337 [Boleophthalmus pectinirostris]
MTCDPVSLGSFGADGPELAGSRLPGNHSVQMMVIAPDDGRRSPRQQPPDDGTRSPRQQPPDDGTRSPRQQPPDDR